MKNTGALRLRIPRPEEEKQLRYLRSEPDRHGVRIFLYQQSKRRNPVVANLMGGPRYAQRCHRHTCDPEDRSSHARDARFAFTDFPGIAEAAKLAKLLLELGPDCDRVLGDFTQGKVLQCQREFFLGKKGQQGLANARRMERPS